MPVETKLQVACPNRKASKGLLQMRVQLLWGCGDCVKSRPPRPSWWQAVIGREARIQMLEQAGRLPDVVVACIGGGSNAIGLFSGFLDDAAVKLVGVEAAGSGVATGLHAATLTAGRPGVLHGTMTYLLQDVNGQIMETHSISAGLDYPGECQCRTAAAPVSVSAGLGYPGECQCRTGLPR
jgi:hypothetical protein